MQFWLVFIVTFLYIHSKNFKMQQKKIALKTFHNLAFQYVGDFKYNYRSISWKSGEDIWLNNLA